MPNYTNNIYNPKDIFWVTYLIIKPLWICRNTHCALSEKDYEALCDTYWINPIYPPDTLAFSQEFNKTTQKAPRKKQPETLEEKIQRKRKELGHIS